MKSFTKMLLYWSHFFSYLIVSFVVKIVSAAEFDRKIRENPKPSELSKTIG